MTMDERTLTALRGSIAKWERLSRLDGYDYGVLDCPLCRLFHPKYVGGIGCVGCPVRERTGQSACDDTPYVEYNVVLKDDDHDREELVAAALEELNFLKSLLPEGETP